MKLPDQSDLVLDLDGLEPAPSQVWGAVRLVPLLRREPIDDLRLARRVYDDGAAGAWIQGHPERRGIGYTAYVPHGYVVEWSSDGRPLAPIASELLQPGAERGALGEASFAMLRRTARKEASNRVRFLPLHLCLEGLLGLHFAGPDVVSRVWSQHARRFGLTPRTERFLPGEDVADLDEALRVFEIHPGQCGVLVFVADALASAFVLPHPDDYRALHASLVQDFYGNVFEQYGLLHGHVQEGCATLDGARVSTADDLRRELARARADWASYDASMASHLVGRDIRSEHVRRLGRFEMRRFLTGCDPQREEHLGEAILTKEGRLAYLKTFRLDRSQCHRARLLSTLAGSGWDLDVAAKALGWQRRWIVDRMVKAELGYLLSQNELDRWR